MHAIEFLDLLRQYRSKNVTLIISVPWNNDENLGIRLKAFIESATESQKRKAFITGTLEERQQALTKQHMANVLNSGVKWLVVE